MASERGDIRKSQMIGDKMIDVMKRLAEFSPTAQEGSFLVTFPVVMHISGGLLDLRITPCEDEYVISCTEDLFSEANADQEYYFNLFTAYDKKYHYEIEIADGVIFKRYPSSFNLTVALNEFIRFFIILDDFIIENDVIGHEEDFPL